MKTQVILLFGRPGVGKLTVAEYLTAEVGYPLLHNHVVVDFATALFAFGTPAFVTLRERLWHLAVDSVLKARSGGVIMTFAPESTVSDGFIPSLQKRVSAGGGSLRFIELVCAKEELEVRLQADSRQRFGKLRDVDQFRKLEKAGAFDKPVMPAAELVIDTGQQPPLESARLIAKHLRPPRTPVT